MCWANPHAFAAPSNSRLTPMRDTATPQRKARILVVEDHDSARAALNKLLSFSGYDVTEAPNGSDALAQLAAGPRPDLIVLDLMMPVMDGWEFMKRQRRDWHLCTIPTIVVSGVPSHDPRCLEMPVVRILPKPYTGDQLMAAIDAEISTRRAPDPLIMRTASPRPTPVPLRRIRI
jgi:CheY-like chemotaxis protein